VTKLFFKHFWKFFLICASVYCCDTVLAENEHEVKKAIKQLSSSLESKKEQFDTLRSEMNTLEKKLGNIANKKYQTEKKIKAIKHKLQLSLKKKQQLQHEVTQQREALVQQLQALHSAGEQSHLRLLLRQDDPSEISRTIKYFEYFNNIRVAKIKAAKLTLTELKQVEANITEKQITHKQWIKQLAAQSKEIKQLLTQRSHNLNKLNSKISSQEKRLERLLAQEAKLQTVVTKVVAQTANNEEVPEISTSIKSPPSTAEKGKKVTTHRVPDKHLSKLKGKLSWPIAGTIIHRYGTKRNGHQKWKGVVLSANGGTKVKAIAKGEVVFADWMEGYGHLIIIQHDKNYLSLYGYNRSLYKKEGSQVKAGEAIAEVGNSGGQSQNALYFEIRKGRKPQNPSHWCK
jgi:septal ring factor EnvC (AmiA/AmiB activator)